MYHKTLILWDMTPYSLVDKFQSMLRHIPQDINVRSLHFLQVVNSVQGTCWWINQGHI